MPEKRPLDIAVISDVHLGIYGCHAKELVQYIDSVDPKILILNGDIIDIWQFSKRYFPKSHTKVIRRLLKLIGKGTQVYYLTGNHDEALRKFAGFGLSNFTIDNKLILDVDGKKHWFFHGDVYDITMKNSKWLAKLGGKGYDFLIILNRLVNNLMEKMGREKMSFSKKIKHGVKQAVKFISDFEQTVAGIAIDKGIDVVCCGHIHQPLIKEMHHQGKTVTYLNSGDWVESLTALEYVNGQWSLYTHPQTLAGQALLRQQDDAQEEEEPGLDWDASLVSFNAVTGLKYGNTRETL
ncbi:UDP-2,3-diacylglucosamine pyrophosphatase LpxH [Chitinophaga costaii]|uniref:UDP-2,3-diacylglucosamine pyrophosphatase LpxH n=1 Tax=Chitinophaga costaii TaxID=1335309 RepID=A0A1C4DP30_9BACT|nr:UDP-2,3-diacylglucosamine diphosphatase [Chitinophaga costaii]PUZ27716.1 UDP-2,3-diacylglucosamine diphosphatase [Chitinophaga costaii]SCC32985.1 UDP-2,3-diacylglucosamine pyrophosphatase LpxH [Chitinophaga costaii]